jgi:hypothetical protein
VLLLALLLAMVASQPARAQENRAAALSWRAALDLRDLPARTRPAALSVSIDAAEAARLGARPLVSLALNGNVIARRFAAASGPTVVNARPEERLLSVRNRVDIAVTLPFCTGPGCQQVLGSVRLAEPLQIGLGPVRADLTDFSQLPTRLRSGVAIEAQDAPSRAFAELAMAALAPRAPVTEQALARIVVSQQPPAGTRPPLRFDQGPVALQRSDGALLASSAALEGLTVVQLLGSLERPVIWVRPGKRLPSELELDEGDVALFDHGGRVLAFAARDGAVVVANQTEAAQRERETRLRRLALLAIWVLITLATLLILRRLPPPRQAGAA